LETAICVTLLGYRPVAQADRFLVALERPSIVLVQVRLPDPSDDANGNVAGTKRDDLAP
jgi:hypothetical protein